jgi:hypothetical protein
MEIYVDNRGALVPLLILGTAGLVAALKVAIAAGDSGFGNPYLVLTGGVGITSALVWSVLRRITRKTRATLETLIEAIGHALDREHAS